MTCVGRFHDKTMLRYSKLTKQVSHYLQFIFITIQFGFKIALHVTCGTTITMNVPFCLSS